MFLLIYIFNRKSCDAIARASETWWCITHNTITKIITYTELYSPKMAAQA